MIENYMIGNEKYIRTDFVKTHYRPNMRKPSEYTSLRTIVRTQSDILKTKEGDPIDICRMLYRKT